jgi:hypothetical protein
MLLTRAMTKIILWVINFDTLTTLLEPFMLLVASVAVGTIGVFFPFYSFLGDLGLGLCSLLDWFSKV